MQNLNDFDRMQQRQKMQTVQQVSNLEGAAKPAPSKYRKFVRIVWGWTVIICVLYVFYSITVDHIKANKIAKANIEAILNSPEMQAERAQEARRQREIAKQRRLKELGIDGISKPTQKNDLLNEQLRKQQIAEQQRLLEEQKQTVDYTQEVAEYNARLREMQAEQARLRNQAR